MGRNRVKGISAMFVILVIIFISCSGPILFWRAVIIAQGQHPSMYTIDIEPPSVPAAAVTTRNDTESTSKEFHDIFSGILDERGVGTYDDFSSPTNATT